MHIDKYKQEDGWYKDEQGCEYEDAESFIQCGLFGHCGCGDPEVSLKYIRDLLELLSKEGRKWEDIKAFFKDAGDGVMYTMFYVLDDHGLTDHGSSVPGWLTEKGKHLLEDITELYREVPDDGGDTGSDSQ